MSKDKGYKSLPLTINRRAVIASATVTKEKNTIHSFAEVDITEPRQKMKSHLEITGEKVPEPIGIKKAQNKKPFEIQNEIRQAQLLENDKLGSLSGNPWFRLIPTFLLKTFIRIGDRNIKMSKKYGKREHLCLTASFDHNIVDGAPASRFMNRLLETIKSGDLLNP